MTIIVIKNHAVYRNGKKLKEPYIKKKCSQKQNWNTQFPKTAISSWGITGIVQKTAGIGNIPLLLKKIWLQGGIPLLAIYQENIKKTAYYGAAFFCVKVFLCGFFFRFF